MGISIAVDSPLLKNSPTKVKHGVLLLALGMGGLLPVLRAEETKYSFYDPSRPGRHLVDSMIVPQAPADAPEDENEEADVGSPVKIYTLLDYPGEKSPKISATFQGGPIALKTQWKPTSGAPRWVKVKAEVPEDRITYAKEGGENKIKVIAEFPDGRKIERELTILGVSIPETEQKRVIGSYFKKTGLNYSMAYRFPPAPLKLGKDVPVLGKYGLNFQLNGRLKISPFEKTCYVETMGQGGIVLSDEEYTLEVGTRDTSEWRKKQWVKTESRLYVGLSSSFTLWEKNLLSVVPKEGKQALDHIPFLGPKFKKTLEDVRIALTADPSLYGEFDLPLEPGEKFEFKNFSFGGELDVQLLACAILELQGFGKFGAQAMLGGKINLDFERAAGFKNLSAEVYVGADFYFLAFESKVRYTMVEFHLPSAPKSSLPRGALPPVEETPLELVPPPEAGEKLEYPLAVLPKSGPLRAGASSLAADKATFNRLGAEKALRRPAMPKAGAGPKPAIEAGAVLPLALNTSSVAWPNLASHLKSGGMLILFGVDKRPPASTEKSSQFTEVRWTYFNNGEWTPPVPLPPGNGAAQIAPSVAVLSDGRPKYLAAWQQLEDPNFQGTGVTDWLNQTQVAVGAFEAEDETGKKVNKWTTELLGVPGRADLAPKVMGHLGEKLDEGMAMWISASVEAVKKNEGAQMPADAEFRFAWYKNGKWVQPDSRAAFPKAPKGLLSWDYGVAMFGGFLVYSEDIGNGNSRVMFYLYNHRAASPDQIWMGPVELSQVPGKNLNPKVTVNMIKGGSIVAIVWNENGNLVVRTMSGGTNSKNTLRPATEGALPPDAKVTALHAPNATDPGMAVSWTEQTERGPSIMTTVFDPNIRRWSKPLAITPGEDLETLYTATTDSAGNLVPLYVHTDISFGDVTAPDKDGKMVTVPNSPIPGREKIMIGRFRPTRDLAFAPAPISVETEDFVAGTTAKLTAHVEGRGMLGFPSVSVSFYHGDPKRGGRLIATGTSAQPLAGGGVVPVSVNWKLADDIWDRDDSAMSIFAVINKPASVTEWNPDNNVASMRVDEIVLSATANAEKALQDGSADVDVVVRNAGYPYTDPFPVKIYDHSGARLIAEEMLPKVAAGGVSTVSLELPKGTILGANGADFLIKVDPDNTLGLHGNPKVETKVHIKSAPH